MRCQRTQRRPRGGRRRRGAGPAAVLVALALTPAAAGAAVPQVQGLWATEVAARSARLHADLQLDPAQQSSYRFNYIAAAAYDANLAAGRDGFSGAKTQPPAAAHLSAGQSQATATVAVSGLASQTLYRYRIVAANADGPATSPVNHFVTQELGGAFTLPDNRGWEMVSPVDKNGGQVDAPGSNNGGGAFQAAVDGNAATFSSAASFAGGADAPPASQYVARRDAAGWTTENVTAPLFSGSYGTEPEGTPYRVFSGDLGRALMLGGRRCRGAATGCGVASPPPSGSGAPSGYENYYLREGGAFSALLGGAGLLWTSLGPAQVRLDLAGATPDLRHAVLSSCAAFAPGAVEAPGGEGCDGAAPNLYLWSGSGLAAVNFLPGQPQTTPGSALAAPAGAISADGRRVYWTAGGGLYLREGALTRPVDEAVGGGGVFEVASADGAVAYFTKAGHLYRYPAGGTVADLTPAGGVSGVLGASVAGDTVYFQDAAGLKRWRAGTTVTVAAGSDAAAPANFPPATGAARVTADGVHLAFLSAAPLRGYDNTGPDGEPVSEVYLYDAASGSLTCVSCNPSNARPLGPSTLPGALANGEGPGATRQYKPRALSLDGRRLFFDSADALVTADTNNEPDVYQWEAAGKGSCSAPGGCLALISSGRSAAGAGFIDASASGDDVFFRTDGSLVATDPGSFDLYVARVGGGFPVPTPPLPCVGDACQSLPSEPLDPTLNTLVEGRGNPAVRFYDTNRRRPIYRRLRNHHHPRGKKHGQGRRHR